MHDDPACPHRVILLPGEAGAQRHLVRTVGNGDLRRTYPRGLAPHDGRCKRRRTLVINGAMGASYRRRRHGLAVRIGVSSQMTVTTD